MATNSSVSASSRTCYCKKEAPLRTAKTELNRGQKFYGCGNFGLKGESPCNYFEWAGAEEEGTLNSKLEHKYYCEALFEGRNKDLMDEVHYLRDQIELEKNWKAEYKMKYELLLFKIRFLIVFVCVIVVYYFVMF